MIVTFSDKQSGNSLAAIEVNELKAAINTNVAAQISVHAIVGDFATNIANAGGKVSTTVIGCVDRFVKRADSGGYLSLAKEIWVPVGDFAASKIKLKSTTTWTFNVDATNYKEESGYTETFNTGNTYINTGFIPASNGLSVKNISLAIATCRDTRPSNFGRLLGGVDGTGDEFCFSSRENIMGPENLYHSNGFGGERTVVSSSWGNDYSRNFLNGQFQSQYNNTSATGDLTHELTLFRSMRPNGMQYASGSIGFYWIGVSLTEAQLKDLNENITALMQDLRQVYKLKTIITIGDSITAGSGAYNAGIERWGKVLARKMGLVEESHAQGYSRLIGDYEGVKAGLPKIGVISGKPATVVAIMFGTNDMSADNAADGTQSMADNFKHNLRDYVDYCLTEGHKIILVTPPYRNDMNVAKHAMYRKAVAYVAKYWKLPFADAAQAMYDTQNPASYVPDGVHPNSAGHLLIGEYVYEAVLGRLIGKPTLDFPSIAANTTTELTTEILNVTPGMTVSIGLPATINSGLMATAFVSADDVVTIRLTNTTNSGINPDSGIYSIMVNSNY